MVLRNITERCWSYSFVRAAKIVCVFFLLSVFYGEGSTGYAQLNLLKSNPAPTPSHQTVQNRPAVQQRAGAQNAQNTQSLQRYETRSLPLGNRNARLLEATNNQVAMKAALEAIPWNRLSNPTKEKIHSVLSSKPLYRRLPQESTYCEPIMYDFLLDHPDVVVAIWENLGVTQISLKEHGRPGVYQLRETVGSTGIVEVLYKTRDYCIAYSKGSYTGPFLPRPIEGETILILKSVFERDEDGDPYVVTQLDAFVKVNNFGVEVFAKMFAPMLGRIADNNFEQTIAFLGNVSEAAQTNPEVIKRLALRLESIRKDVREEFIQVAYHTAQMAIDRSGDGLNSPYGQQLVQRQTAKQQQEFDQERARYLQNLKRLEQLQKERQEQQRQQSVQRNALPPTLEARREKTQPTVPTSKPPTALLVKPKNTYTIEDMGPANDFSRNLEAFDKMPSAPSKPSQSTAQNTTPLNLDLDLDLGLEKPVRTLATSNATKNQNESSDPDLDLKLETPKVATKEPASDVPSQPPLAAGKAGGAVFATPTISR
ncbi:MAG: hypothetical protein FWC43_10510 [Planctomycetaceae bacterium]|nr:hypothetical protein [Planctomycetaceae bacterium]